MNRDQPTIYLSNWSSHRTPGMHGPGRKLTIMARPRAWEHGDGAVASLTPTPANVEAVKAGRMSLEAYHAATVADFGAPIWSAPGALTAFDRPVPGAPLQAWPVVDGDTLCCACSVAESRAGRCHRAWAAPHLVRAGWRVVLDGVEVPS